MQHFSSFHILPQFWYIWTNIVIKIKFVIVKSLFYQIFIILELLFDFQKGHIYICWWNIGKNKISFLHLPSVLRIWAKIVENYKFWMQHTCFLVQFSSNLDLGWVLSNWKRFKLYVFGNKVMFFFIYPLFWGFEPKSLKKSNSGCKNIFLGSIFIEFGFRMSPLKLKA